MQRHYVRLRRLVYSSWRLPWGPASQAHRSSSYWPSPRLDFSVRASIQICHYVVGLIVVEMLAFAVGLLLHPASAAKEHAHAHAHATTSGSWTWVAGPPDECEWFFF